MFLFLSIFIKVSLISQPTHGGSLTQAGMNMGPLHAHIWGWAKSFVKELIASHMVQSDKDIIGTSFLIWSMIESAVPTETSDHVNNYLESEQLPRIAIRNVAEDMIYFLLFFLEKN